MNESNALKSILFIAANPKGTMSLRLQEEEREIKERLRLVGYGKVPINSIVATRPRDIQPAMLDFKPQIVHFSGHGVGQSGLVFEDINGHEKLVSSEALASLFKLFSNYVKCVVLNACYSNLQAEAIAQYVDYVIGMSKSIGDRAAIEFSVGFYTALGVGESIEFAYELGCNSIQLEGISEHSTPILFKKKELLTSCLVPDTTDFNIPNFIQHTSTETISVSGRGSPNEVSYKSEILRLLVSAQSELRPIQSYSLLLEALKLCNKWQSADRTNETVILNAHVLKELASEEKIAEERTKRWKEALNILEKKLAADQTSGHSLADAYSVIAVRSFQDKHSNLSKDECKKYLVKAKRFLDPFITRLEVSSVKALLLTRKSSILRHLANLEVSEFARVNKLNESIRCAELALSFSRDGNTLLELGLATWSLARHQSSDEKYTSELRKAEKYLSDELLEPLEEAQLAKSFFYRMNYRSLEACETFPCSSEQMKRTRRMLQSAWVYAEAAIALWYANCDKVVYEPHLLESKNLLETAISSGYLTARNVVNLAFIQAILGDISSAETALSDICGDKSISWNQAIELVTSVQSTDHLSFGFALGIEDGSTLSKLGTFAIVFLKNNELAESLYRAAVRSDPHNANVLTNLARFLVHYRANDNTSIREAKSLLQKAQNFADRRFKWWKIVQSELNLLESKPKETPKVEPNSKTFKVLESSRDISELPFDKLKDLKRHFSKVDKFSNRQQQGYELEKLIYNLAQLTFGTAAPAYRMDRAHGGISQIDGYFEHNSGQYRVECKWLSKPVDHNDIVILSDKLDAIGISGFFVSMSGFTEAAIGRAHELKKEKAILLVDGEEIRDVFLGKLNFDEVVSLKRKHFNISSNPYFRVGNFRNS